MIHLILGGARSGKSSFAEQWCLSTHQDNAQALIYVATATAFDHEMNARITQHQADRDARWQLLECPLNLSMLLTSAAEHHLYLVDCLTLWLNNIIFSLGENYCAEQAKTTLQLHIDTLVIALCTASKQNNTDIVLVSNEVGLGVIPLGESTRLFVDYAGWLNQAIAKIADRVTLVTAGIPMVLKPQ